jgi:hypothetical protein
VRFLPPCSAIAPCDPYGSADKPPFWKKQVARLHAKKLRETILPHAEAYKLQWLIY